MYYYHLHDTYDLDKLHMCIYTDVQTGWRKVNHFVIENTEQQISKDHERSSYKLYLGQNGIHW